MFLTQPNKIDIAGVTGLNKCTGNNRPGKIMMGSIFVIENKIKISVFGVFFWRVTS